MRKSLKIKGKSASGIQSDVRASKESTQKVKIKHWSKLKDAQSCIPMHGCANGENWPCTPKSYQIPSRAKNGYFARPCNPMHGRSLPRSQPINSKLIPSI
ncbi:hypothetical protein L1987_40130 [Smallanthus sonchifolius]|uniref:Uncharacterized protein n=1 Tax=Smallanthus sonchifolius TaxID=185202 RepID=A0ACB9GSM8_9ASTR|nr:hypothetical protein L1987_40130 [Smallanthus sonchifolius]